MPTPSVVRRRRTVKASILLLALALSVAILARIYPVRYRPLELRASITDEESRIMELVNRTRRAGGRSPLAWSPRLAVVARGHSYDMALRHYFAHESLDGLTPADRIRGVGIDYQELGENIYLDENPDAGLPERAIQGWMASPHHRDNLLSGDFRWSGIGVSQDSNGKTYVTQDFIR
ncbi:MAG TPA: CAP domain-containing protein [Candidatus Binataceae bacterium]|jgi:uncharacterized protein YkwD